jgi:hypothetical protein
MNLTMEMGSKGLASLFLKLEFVKETPESVGVESCHEDCDEGPPGGEKMSKKLGESSQFRTLSTSLCADSACLSHLYALLELGYSMIDVLELEICSSVMMDWVIQ